jgi:hypothetical protein
MTDYRIKHVRRVLKEWRRYDERNMRINHHLVFVERHANWFIKGVYVVFYRGEFIVCHTPKEIAEIVYSMKF